MDFHVCIFNVERKPIKKQKLSSLLKRTDKVDFLIHKIHRRRAYVPYLLYEHEIDILDKYLQIVGYPFVKQHFNHGVLDRIIDVKRKYFIKQELIESFKQKRIKEACAWLSCKKLCPDLERLVCEYI